MVLIIELFDIFKCSIYIKCYKVKEKKINLFFNIKKLKSYLIIIFENISKK